MAVTAQNGPTPLTRAKRGSVVLVSDMATCARRCCADVSGKSSADNCL